MPNQLDEIDRKIIAALQTDGKATVSVLAEKVGLSASPCARRVRLLERNGVIKGYAAVIDQNKVGLPVSAFASVKLERQREDALEHFSKAVARWPEVLECYLVSLVRRQKTLMNCLTMALMKSKLPRLFNNLLKSN